MFTALLDWSVEWTYETLNISYERVHRTVNVDLDIRKYSAKWISRYLNIDQKHTRIASRSICAQFQKDVDVDEGSARFEKDADFDIIIYFLLHFCQQARYAQNFQFWKTSTTGAGILTKRRLGIADTRYFFPHLINNGIYLH